MRAWLFTRLSFGMVFLLVVIRTVHYRICANLLQYLVLLTDIESESAARTAATLTALRLLFRWPFNGNAACLFHFKGGNASSVAIALRSCDSPSLEISIPSIRIVPEASPGLSIARRPSVRPSARPFRFVCLPTRYCSCVNLCVYASPFPHIRTRGGGVTPCM